MASLSRLRTEKLSGQTSAASLSCGGTRQDVLSVCRPGCFSRAMIWFREWGIGTEVDEETGMRATLRMREALGETRSLMEASGHVFSPDEFADARAFWTLAIIFGW